MSEEVLKEFRDAVRQYEQIRIEVSNCVICLEPKRDPYIQFAEGRVSGLSIALLKLGMTSEEVDRVHREETEKIRDELAREKEVCER